MPARKATKKKAKRGEAAAGFTAAERAAMRDRVEELKAERRTGGKQDDEAGVLAKIAELPPRDRALAERLHELVRANAPTLTAKLWYGMPAYARNGKVVCFFQPADKFKARYSTFGFSDQAKLDDGVLWPTSYAVEDLNPAAEARIAALVKKAVS